MILYSDDDLSKLFSKVKETYDLIRAIKTRTERKRVKEYNESVFSYREKVARSHLFPDEFYCFKIHNDRIEVCRSSKGLYYISCNCSCLYESRWHPSFPTAEGSFFKESSCAFNYFPTRDFYEVIRAFPEVIKAYLVFEYNLEIF